jgi:hypothetical protein
MSATFMATTSSTINKNYIEIREGWVPGKMTFDSHWKSMERWVWMKHAVFFSVCNVSTLFRKNVADILFGRSPIINQSL